MPSTEIQAAARSGTNGYHTESRTISGAHSHTISYSYTRYDRWHTCWTEGNPAFAQNEEVYGYYCNGSFHETGYEGVGEGCDCGRCDGYRSSSGSRSGSVTCYESRTESYSVANSYTVKYHANGGTLADDSAKADTMSEFMIAKNIQNDNEKVQVVKLSDSLVTDEIYFTNKKSVNKHKPKRLGGVNVRRKNIVAFLMALFVLFSTVVSPNTVPISAAAHDGTSGYYSYTTYGYQTCSIIYEGSQLWTWCDDHDCDYIGPVYARQYGCVNHGPCYVQYDDRCPSCGHSITHKSWWDDHRAGDSIYTYWTTTGVNSYTTTYASNTISGSVGAAPANQSVKWNESFTTATNTFTRENYTFVGWSQNPDADIRDESVIVEDENNYTAVNYYVAYPSTTKPPTVIIKENISAKHNLGTESDGWNLNGGTATLYAIWEGNPYTQTVEYYVYTYDAATDTWDYVRDDSMTENFDAEYGDIVNIDGTNISYGTAGYTYDIEIPEKSGYYYYDCDGDGQLITDSYTFKVYYKPNGYNIRFNINGGTQTLPVADMYAAVSQTVYLPSLIGKWYKTNYKFAGWATSATAGLVEYEDGSAVVYSDGQGVLNLSLVNNSVVDLYAIWVDDTKPTVSVSKNSVDWCEATGIRITAADVGDGLSPTNVYQYCLSTNTTSPEADITWKSFANGEDFIIGSDLDGEYYLYVKPVYDKYGNASTDTYHKFGPYKFDNGAPTCNIPATIGWFDKATEVSFDITDTNSGIKSITLSNFDGVPIADITSTKKYIFSTEGINFYSVKSVDNLDHEVTNIFVVKVNTQTPIEPPYAVWKGTDNLVVKAKWQANTYNVTIDYNKPDNASNDITNDDVTDKTVVYDSPYGPLPVPELPGWDFEGWYTDPDVGTKITETTVYDTPDDSTIYAHWKPKEFTVFFDYNKPAAATTTMINNSVVSKTVKYDFPYGELPNPILPGWQMNGWFTAATSGTQITEDTIYRNLTDTTIYVQWDLGEYEIRLHTNKPSNAIAGVVKKNPSGWTWDSNGYYVGKALCNTASIIPALGSVYTLAGYEGTAWHKETDAPTLISAKSSLSALYDDVFGFGNAIWNLTDNAGMAVDLYPQWTDTTGPVITVSPTETVSEGTNHAVKNIDVTITVNESGSGLNASNKYEYALSKSNTSAPVNGWTSYADNVGSDAAYGGALTNTVNIGDRMEGIYYLWIRGISDRDGNKSTTPSVETSRSGRTGDTAWTRDTAHVYGTYCFDNLAPNGSAKYVETPYTLGIGDKSVGTSPYAVITVAGVNDNLSGVDKLILHIEDASDSSNYKEYDLTKKSDDIYEVIFDLYDSLTNSNDVGSVIMYIKTLDKAGNEGVVEISAYDFGEMQNGNLVQASNLHFEDLGEGKYKRDNFRVEAYIYNRVDDTREFVAGTYGDMYIYTFGYVDTLTVNFASLRLYHRPEYDVDPNLPMTAIPSKLTNVYRHAFEVPMYAPDGKYNDIAVLGVKEGKGQVRNPDLTVSGSIISSIRTILKYQ